MYTIDKLKVIKGLKDHKEAQISKVGNQSIKVLHTCGCYFVQHLYAGNPNILITNKNYERVIVNRHFFAELCPTHNQTN